MSKIVFLDTNVYLHYQPFDQIDWLKIVQAATVMIVVPPVTVRELNKRKDSPSQMRVKKRAGETLKKLFALFESGSRAQLKDAIDLLLEDREPIIDFAAYQLSRDTQDDNLIASIIAYRDEVPEAEICLVTSDAGLTLLAKAKRQRITTIKLPDNLKLPDEPDAERERIKELEQKLRELESRQPQLSLVFEDGNQHVRFGLPHPIELTKDELEKKLEEVKQRSPRMPEQPDEPHNVQGFLADLKAALLVSTEDIARYNTKLDEFYRAYAEYLQEYVRFENLRGRTIRLAIWLSNDGTAPAEDIDIFMCFPQGFTLVSESDFPDPPTPPEPPKRPKTAIEQLSDTLNMPYLQSPDLQSLGLPSLDRTLSPPNVSTPDIRRMNSYEVHFHVQRVKHKLMESLGVLCVVFERFESACSFQIDYRILAADLPNETSGKLHVIVNKTQTV